MNWDWDFFIVSMVSYILGFIVGTIITFYTLEKDRTGGV